MVVDSAEITQLSDKALASLPQPLILPSFDHIRNAFPQPAEEPLSFVISDTIRQTDISIPLRPVMDPETVLTALASSQKLRAATKLDRQGILRRLTVQWSARAALTDSVEKFPSHENGLRADGSMPFLKISPGLMHIDNKSLQSLARSSRNVGVGDLREALEGRASANRSATALGYSPSLSSVGHASTADGAVADVPMRPRSSSTLKGTNGDVKDILNKLGIGKQQSARAKGVFRTPLPPKRVSSDSTQ